MEDRSLRIVRDLLPEHWVVRDYRPDYGIDLLIELFEFADAGRTEAATLGETLFVQVKSVEVVDSTRLRLHPRRNVEVAPLQEDPAEASEIEVVRLRLECSELMTVQAIGSAIPVLLFLVELSTRRIYFISLNDVIDKVVIPQDPAFGEKASKVLHIPMRNCIVAHDPGSVRPLETYGKRPKLYAAFEKFAYQRHELDYALAGAAGAGAEQREGARRIMDLVRHFLPAVLRYDFWTRMPEWALIDYSYRELLALQELLRHPDVHEDLPALQGYLLGEPATTRDEQWVRSMDLPAARREVLVHIGQVWHGLANLARVYQEFGREWFLPTYLSEQSVIL